MAGKEDFLLAERQRVAGGDEKLLLHQVSAGDHLSDRVLHLDPGIHLYEVRGVRFRVVEKLHGAHAGIVDRCGKPHCCSTHLGAGNFGQVGGAGLFHDFLPTALQGTVALAQVHETITVAEDLDLHVARRRNEPLDVDGATAESGRCLCLRDRKLADEFIGMSDDPDSAATAARSRFDGDRVADLLRDCARRSRVLYPTI